MKACEELNSRIAPIKETLKDKSWVAFTRECELKMIDLTVSYT